MPRIARPTEPPSAPTVASVGSTPAALSLIDVHKTYPGVEPVHALRGVSLRIAPGSLTAIVGPSGSGKSTLLNCAAGLDTPTSGKILISGFDVSDLAADPLTRFRREHVGFVFQSYNLVSHLTVLENIQLPAMLAGVKAESDWLAELMAAVGITGLDGRRPTELSGGQAQRVAIARALSTRPDVLFADEPTGALDLRTGVEVLQLLKQAAQLFGQTVVVVTHDPRVAAVTEQVLIVADGQIIDRLDSPDLGLVSARMLEMGQ